MFGSQARGEASVGSDLDILVVMESDQPRQSRAHLVRNLIRPRQFSLDVVVYTPEEFREAAEHKDYYFNPFIKDVIEEGVVMYERAS